MTELPIKKKSFIKVYLELLNVEVCKDAFLGHHVAAVVPGGGGDDGLELGVNLPVSCAGLGSNFTVLE